MNEWILFTIGMLLTVGTGLFVAAEFSMVALDRSDLQRRQAGGAKGLGVVIHALEHTSTHLSSAQLGITLTTLLAGYTLEPALSSFLTPAMAWINVPESAQSVITVPLAVAIATVISMIVGELVPKNFAISLPRQTAVWVVPFQVAFTTVFRPAVMFLNGSANAILRGLGLEPKEELSGARSAEELSSLVRHSASQGTLEQDTATLLDRTLRFADLSAVDVMTPRLQMESIHLDEPVQAVLTLSGTTGFSRFPVIDDDRDDVVGVVHVKKAVALPRAKRGEVPTAAVMEDAARVPETMPLDSLLEELRGAGYQCAIVVDEYGGTAGFVTLEDLVEEIIGEVADEHDRVRSGVVTSRDALLIPADLRPDEVREQSDLEIPEDPSYDTVAGFVLHQLGRIPELGDVVELPGAGTLRVERMDGRRVSRLRFTRFARSGEEPISPPTGSIPTLRPRRARKGGDSA